MEIRQLQYFVAAVENRSFSKAAEKMNVSQSALGMQIKKLELELAGELFVRHSRGAEVTEIGEKLLIHAKSISKEILAAKHISSKNIDEKEENVIIGMTASTSSVVAAPLLHRLSEMSPVSRVTIVEEMSSVLAERVSKNRITLALAFNSSHFAGLRWEPVLEEPLYFVESAECGKTSGGTITLAEVADHRLALPGVPSSIRNILENAAAAQNLALNVPFDVHSISIIRTLISQKVASSIVPYTVFRDELISGQFISKRIVEPALVRELHFVMSDRHPLPLVAKIVKRELQLLLKSEVMQPEANWLPLQDRTAAINRAYVAPTILD